MEVATKRLRHDATPIEELREEARQALWRAFARAVRERQVDACYSILDLHRATTELMENLP
jgi:hypothetical protein